MTDEARVGDELTARVGELRRLTIMFCDVVGSTALSSRLEPETYRTLMGGYRDACRDVIESRFDGHIVRLQGDGTLSVFGVPVAHENDAERAVRAGLALVRAMHDLSAAAPTAGELLDVRVGVHHGPVYVDFDEDDIYGLAANVAARIHSLADPGQVVVSEEVRELVEDHFEIEACEPRVVQGVEGPLRSFCVVGERAIPAQASWSTPLVEREAELGRLRDAWDRVAAHAAGTRPVLVRGDAGVGKSRLVAAVTDEVRPASTRVVELHGSPFHVDAGFHPVRTLIEARCAITDDTKPPERLAGLVEDVTNLGLDRSSTVPLLAPVLDIEPSAGYDEVETGGRKLEELVSQAVLDYVVACIGAEPAILVAENLHWFDASTRTLLSELVRARPRGLLIVATSRNREPGPWETIELGPLTQAGRLAIIDALDEAMAEEARLALSSRSGGIPLYLEELVRAGAIPDPIAGDTSPVPGSVPEVLYEPLVARLYATPAALPVAATVAAAGQQVDRSLLSATMSMPAEELEEPLRDLVAAQILERIPSGPARYQFRHELLREVAYELQPPSWRRKVHSRLCDFLTRDDEPGDWRVLASHFERAERHLEATRAYQQTAESARRRGALDEARSHLTRAIDLLPQIDDVAARARREVELRLRRGFLAMTGEGAASVDAAADFDRCLELAAGHPSRGVTFSTLTAIWVYDLSRAELGRARHASEELRDALRTEPHHFRAPNRASFGMLDWFCGRFTSAVEILTAAIDDLTEVGREAEIAADWFVPNDAPCAMRVHLALAQFMTADISAADQSLARALDVASGLDFPQGPWSAGYANWIGSWIWIEQGRLEQADKALADLRSSSARHGFDNWELVAATQTAVLEAIPALRSNDADAVVLSEHAEAIGAFIELWNALGLRVFEPFYLTTIGALLAAAGDHAGARQRYEESLSLAAQTDMRFYDAETARLAAHLNSDPRPALEAALDLARSQGARPFELRIALDLHELSGEEARPQLEQAMRPFGDATTIDLEAARARTMAPR